MSHPRIDAIVALDVALLADHTARAGDVFDADAHRGKLEKSLARSEVVCVTRNGSDVAHTYFWPLKNGVWFVGGFSVAPEHRNASVMSELARGIADAMERNGIVALESHVYRTNAASIRFHERLGFVRIAENEKGFAFRGERAVFERWIGMAVRR